MAVQGELTKPVIVSRLIRPALDRVVVARAEQEVLVRMPFHCLDVL